MANLNDKSTWAYPNINKGIVITRNSEVTNEEIHKIYCNCINIQRKSLLRQLRQKQHKD